MGRGDVAFLLASNKTYPSYGYMIEKGATAIWELWNGDTANRWMNSCNHILKTVKTNIRQQSVKLKRKQVLMS